MKIKKSIMICYWRVNEKSDTDIITRIHTGTIRRIWRLCRIKRRCFENELLIKPDAGYDN